MFVFVFLYALYAFQQFFIDFDKIWQEGASGHCEIQGLLIFFDISKVKVTAAIFGFVAFFFQNSSKI